VQFADAELIGCPVRLTVSKRSLAAGGVEAMLRADPEAAGEIVPPAELSSWLARSLGPH
jgi:prolyl-tRNA synthetase